MKLSKFPVLFNVPNGACSVITFVRTVWSEKDQIRVKVFCLLIIRFDEEDGVKQDLMLFKNKKNMDTCLNNMLCYMNLTFDDINISARAAGVIEESMAPGDFEAWIAGASANLGDNIQIFEGENCSARLHDHVASLLLQNVRWYSSYILEEYFLESQQEKLVFWSNHD